MKKSCILLICFLLIVCMPCAAFAAQAQEHIQDDCGLLSRSEISKLDSRISQIADAYDLEIRILTVDSLKGKSAQRYADDYYDDHMLDCHAGNGILLVIAMDRQEWAVTANGLTHSVITNSNIDGIMDDVLPDFSDGFYYQAFNTFLDGVQQEYQRYAAGEDDGQLGWGAKILIAVLIGAAVGGITILVMRSGMKTVKPQHSATSYMIPGSYHLTHKADFYLYSRTTRTPKPKNNSSGGGSRGGRSGRF